MDQQQRDLIEQDLQTGASILSLAESNWEMVKNPEPILYVLARRAAGSSNDWIPGADLVEDLIALRREDSKNFNPHGWFGKELTDVRGGKDGGSPAIGRWAPFIERSEKQPFKYRLLPELYHVVTNYDLGTATGTGTDVPADPRHEGSAAQQAASAVGFIYETHLQDHIERSWSEVSAKMGLTGYDLAERDCDLVGTADIVARSRESGDWVVIELKRSDVVDVAIGQITRYMSWVKEHRAGDAPVRGVLVARQFDEKTRYSARAIPGLTLWKYSLSFSLEPDMRE